MLGLVSQGCEAGGLTVRWSWSGKELFSRTPQNFHMIGQRMARLQAVSAVLE